LFLNIFSNCDFYSNGIAGMCTYAVYLKLQGFCWWREKKDEQED
jgi:hypothetical protein